MGVFEREKKAIRQEILLRRKNISLVDRQKKSQMITDKLIALPCFSSSLMMIYVSFNSEVITRELISYALGKGRKVMVPVVDLESHQLKLSEIKGYDDLIPSTYGIKEPRELKVVSADEVELFILPGVAFDERGIRLGYGGGFFDRLLENGKKDQILIGLAYELQIQKELPCADHDISMNMVVTEDKIRSFNLGFIRC